MPESNPAISAHSSFCSRLFAPKVTIEKGATALAVAALALTIIGALAFRIHYPATVAFLNEQAVRIGLMAGGGALFIGVIISLVIREMRRKSPTNSETAPAATPAATPVPLLPEPVDWKPLTGLLGENTTRYESAISESSTIKIDSIVGVRPHRGDRRKLFGIVLNCKDNKYTIHLTKCHHIMVAHAASKKITIYDEKKLLDVRIKVAKAQSLPGKNPEDFGLEEVKNTTPPQKGDIVGLRRLSGRITLGLVLENNGEAYTISIGSMRWVVPHANANDSIVTYDRNSVDRAIISSFYDQAYIDYISEEKAYYE